MGRDPGRPGPAEPSLGRLFGTFIGNLQDLIRGELRLAREELKEEGRVAAAGAGLIVGGVVLALIGGIFVGLALTYGLARFMPDWLAALIVAALALVGAALLLNAGRRRLQHLDPVPRRTLESLREDTEWVRQRISSDKS
jgi:drug/metabolite transporter superfamily protein YnfA